MFLAPQLDAAIKRFNVDMVQFVPFWWGIKDDNKMFELNCFSVVIIASLIKGVM